MLLAPVAFIRAKAQEWARQRQGADRDPLVLGRARLYILPTAQGFVFSALLFALLLGSMNYNNSLGLALTFTLAGLGLVAMHHCHRNLLDLVLRFAGAEPVFAGQNACFTLLLDNRSGRARYGLQLEVNERRSAALDLAPGESGRLTLELPTRTRGILKLDRFSVSSTFPLGLFRAWSWIHLAPSVVVYPQPAATSRAPPHERTDTGGAQDDTQGEADFAGLRNFRPGDSPRRVAWKAYARAGEVMVKQYAGTDVATHWFDWNSLVGLDVEERLSQLCRWIVDAQGHGHAYGLRLPAERIEPNLGTRHRHRCLSALALFGT
jgi:uncharacterized protein (DUF58 family)